MAPNIVDLRFGSKPPRRSDKTSAPSKQPHKREPLRARRRKLRIYAIIGAVVFIAFAIFAIHWISYRPALRIQSISVRGTTEQNPDLIAAFVREDLAALGAHYIAADNVFAYQKARLDQDVLKQFPRLKSVRIGRGGIFSTTLIANVDERDPYGTWCVSDASTSPCYVFDKDGFVYATRESTRQQSALPYEFFGGLAGEPIRQTYLQGHLAGMVNLLTRMQESGFAPISVQIESDQDFSVHVKNGYNVKATFGEDVQTLVSNLQLVAVSGSLRSKEGDLEYIDLRFGNRVYYKLKGESAQQSQDNPAPTTQ